MGLTFYNGFTPTERETLGQIGTAAFRSGNLKLEPICRLCGLHGTIKGTAGGHLMMHYEDYDRPLQPVVICVECHLRLHSRFRCPNRWFAHCLRIRTEAATPYPSVGAYFGATRGQYRDIPAVDFTPIAARWWERLSLDPRIAQKPAVGFEFVRMYAPGREGDVDALSVTIVRTNDFSFA